MTNERQVIAFVAHRTYRNDECDQHDYFVMSYVDYKTHSKESHRANRKDGVRQD